MSTGTRTVDGLGAQGNWRAGVLGGVAGALVMGALVVTMNTPTIAVAIPSLYTLAPPQNPAAGLVVHAAHGAVLGVAFAGLAGVAGVDSLGRTVAGGVAWGVATWVLFAALVMPLWLWAIGSPASPPFPNFAPPSLLWHAVYGLVLGGVYAATTEVV
ncbi:histidine kinase [Halobaculum sp. MBLA0143]|uniref:histidine kinase n=1 Tax=Halobaculum sp. MBLA0143 TaxID=3079933 RepID=UPI00352594FC